MSDIKKIYIVSYTNIVKSNPKKSDIYILGAFVEEKKAKDYIKKYLYNTEDPGYDNFMCCNLDVIDISKIKEEGSEIFVDFPEFEEVEEGEIEEFEESEEDQKE